MWYCTISVNIYVFSFTLGQFVKPRKRSARTERLPRLPAVLTFPRPVSPERHMRMTLSTKIMSSPTQQKSNKPWFVVQTEIQVCQVFPGMTWYDCLHTVCPTSAFDRWSVHSSCNAFAGQRDRVCWSSIGWYFKRYFWDHRHFFIAPLALSHQTAPSNSTSPCRCFSWRCWLPWIITCISFGLRPAAR